MVSNTLFTSNTEERYTPKDFFEEINKEFKFTLDPCATKENHKCDKFYTKEEDWLKQNRDNEIVFCNPPYWKEIKKRVEKWSLARGGGGCYAFTCKNRYPTISQLYLLKSRNQIYQRSFEILMSEKFRSVPKYACNI